MPALQQITLQTAYSGRILTQLQVRFLTIPILKASVKTGEAMDRTGLAAQSTILKGSQQ
jgi:hypothetical protein